MARKRTSDEYEPGWVVWSIVVLIVVYVVGYAIKGAIALGIGGASAIAVALILLALLTQRKKHGVVRPQSGDNAAAMVEIREQVASEKTAVSEEPAVAPEMVEPQVASEQTTVSEEPAVTPEMVE